MEWLTMNRTEWRKTAWSGWLKTEQSGGRQHGVVDYEQNRVEEDSMEWLTMNRTEWRRQHGVVG